MFQGASYERYVVYGVRPLRKRRVASRMTISGGHDKGASPPPAAARTGRLFASRPGDDQGDDEGREHDRDEWIGGRRSRKPGGELRPGKNEKADNQTCDGKNGPAGTCHVRKLWYGTTARTSCRGLVRVTDGCRPLTLV
jgi:hypothetical protein